MTRRLRPLHEPGTKGIVFGQGPRPTKPPPPSSGKRMVAIPDPGEWERMQAVLAECNHAEPVTPEVTESDNPIVATLLGPDGHPIRQWRQRPPFGYQRP